MNGWVQMCQPHRCIVKPIGQYFRSVISPLVRKRININMAFMKITCRWSTFIAQTRSDNTQTDAYSGSSLDNYVHAGKKKSGENKLHSILIFYIKLYFN